MAAGVAAAGVAGRGVDHGGQSVDLKYDRQKNCQAEQDGQDDIKKSFILKCVRFTRGWTSCKQSSSWRLQELVIKVQRVSRRSWSVISPIQYELRITGRGEGVEPS
jgi:hypothetical protein